MSLLYFQAEGAAARYRSLKPGKMNGHKRQPLFGANADWLANLPAEMHARRVLRELRFDLRQSPSGRGNACALAHVVARALPAMQPG